MRQLMMKTGFWFTAFLFGVGVDGFQQAPSFTLLHGAKSTQATNPMTTSSNGCVSSSALGIFPFGKQSQEVQITETIIEEDESWTDFGSTPQSYLYAISWISLVSFAILGPGDFSSPADTAMLQSIIENPTSPDINPFFFAIFNLFAILPIALACAIAPRARDEGIPAGPPLVISSAIAYFIMGPYLALRKTPKTEIINPEEEFGWFTRNLWENKLFNYGTLGFGILCLLAGAPGLVNPSESWNGFIELIQTSKFASVSMADLSMITLILTKEVADDYKIRCSPESVDKAGYIGASTALLPILGTAIYCVARPPIEEK